MSIAINPVFPVIAAQGVASDVVLQPGTVIDAQVMKVLENNLVRIAIASLSIEVLSEVPLQVGQALQLAVSQTADGIRLQVVPGQSGAGTAVTVSPSPATVVTTSGAATGTGNASANMAADEVASTAAVSLAADQSRTTRPLTNLEALAVSAAVQAAAARQGSLAPLFANLGVAVSLENLPPEVQRAAAQLLSSRPELGQNLTGEAVKTAFRNSGLFLEHSLAASQAGGGPDLKAALIVLRQTLSSWLGQLPGTAAAADEAGQAAPGTFAQQGQARAQSAFAASPSLAPQMQIDVDEIMLPQASLQVADDIFTPDGKMQIFAPPNSAGRAHAGQASLQDILQAFPKGVRDAVKTLLDAEAGMPGRGASPVNDDEFAHSNVPPPPFRGGAPSAQAIASPAFGADAPPVAVAHHLLDDTDAALARQTLLQVASLPDRPDLQSPRLDPTMPRWNFEIPFATPQGTAMAQFEISRDGTGTEIESAKRMWRARFSLNVEPTGPVHALVSLSGERTSVRMWAERPLTAAQLRANAPQLSQALRQADLVPGDIVIGDGAPPSPAQPPAGHFLDRAL